MTDAEVVTRALAGSADAYAELVRRYERPVFALIVRMVRDAALAEDLAQEVFLKAFRALPRFDTRRKLSSWLFKIAHNRTIDHLRRSRPLEVPLTVGDADEGTEREVLAAPSERSPVALAERAELAAAIEEALGNLRPQYREILLLRFQQGLSYLEIVEVTGLAMGTVKIQLHRARKQLAAALAEAGFAPPERWAPAPEKP